MDKDFYNNNKGTRCPDKLFTKDVQKIKHSIDNAMATYDRSVSPEEVEALFLSANPTLTTAQKSVYKDMFTQLKETNLLDKDIAHDIMSTLFRQVVGEEVANIGFDFVNGDATTLEPLRRIIESYADDFIPSVQIEWEETDILTLIKEHSLEPKWKFNIRSLARRVSGIGPGHLIAIGAQSNTGKTSFHASLVMGDGGFADQGAKVVILCNEESAKRVRMRYINAALGMMGIDMLKDIDNHRESIKRKFNNVKITDGTSRNIDWVEAVCKVSKPDILILDMGDKFAKTSTTISTHELLKQNAIHARQIAKQHDCAIFYMSQLSAEATGRVVLDQTMMEGSKTGKAAEADLMILIAKDTVKNPDGGEEESPARHLNVVKNKLSGWHGVQHCELDYLTARYL